MRDWSGTVGEFSQLSSNKIKSLYVVVLKFDLLAFIFHHKKL